MSDTHTPTALDSAVQKKIVLVSTGRSGTKHFATVSKKLGFQVGHEEWLADGISSWCLVSKLPYSPWGPSWKELPLSEFVICHQLRNPVTSIPSLMTMNTASWSFIREDAGERISNAWWRSASPRQRAMWHWLDWNQRAKDMASVHWTLDAAAQIGPDLNETLGWKAVKDQWADQWMDRGHTNNAKSRIPKRERLWIKDPRLAIRRWRHALGKIQATEEALFDADRALAKDILEFWSSFQSQYQR